MADGPKIFLDFPTDKIQGIRALQSLLELLPGATVGAGASSVLEYLAATFDLRYHVGTADGCRILRMNLDHRSPSCNVGPVSKPLMFPSGMFELLRRQWKTQRQTRFLFAGLMTQERKHWLEQNLAALLRRSAHHLRIVPNEQGRLSRLWNKLRGATLSDQELPDIGLSIRCSERGRRFPEKIWDTEYYEMM
jgi:hypothetical protein